MTQYIIVTEPVNSDDRTGVVLWKGFALSTYEAVLKWSEETLDDDLIEFINEEFTGGDETFHDHGKSFKLKLSLARDLIELESEKEIAIKIHPLMMDPEGALNSETIDGIIEECSLNPSE